jgi:7,8-dihydropterin-6-yl-methyl-4-(beta-D-ribofuranosyl)aminobenzene 5'-phosphate synthase
MVKVLGIVFVFSIMFYIVFNSNSREQTDKGKKKSVRITILYDNYVSKEGTQADWGFSCLIEGTEKTILFDTGTDPEILMHNVRQLKVGLKKIDAIILSHEHRDHTGGLLRIIKENRNLKVYVLKSFTNDLVKNIENYGIDVVRIKHPVKICSGVYTTGEMGSEIKEQSLILESDSGMVIITGCSHPGIMDILLKTKNIFKEDIYFVFGGFHLLDHSENQLQEIINQFIDLGVKKVGPTHCTGEVAIEMFRNAFGSEFVQMGTGLVIRL